MTEPRAFTWSTFCAYGLTVSVAVLGVVGSVAMFAEVDGLYPVCVFAFGAMFAFAVLNSNNAAAAALHALSRDRLNWATLAPAFICTIGFAIASLVGVHLGYEILAAQAAHPERLPDAWMVNAAALFLAVGKPAMAWIVEGRREMDREDVKRAADEQEAALQRARAFERADAAAARDAAAGAPEADSAPGLSRRAAPAASRRLARELGRQRPTSSRRAGAPVGEVRPAAGVPSRPVTLEELRRTVADMTAEGEVVSFRAVARRLDVPRSRIERLAQRSNVVSLADLARAA